MATPVQSKFEISQLKKENEEEIKKMLQIGDESNLAKWSAEDYRQEINNENSLILIAKIRGSVIGFLGARSSDTELDVLNFGVFGNYQKHGVGTMLWNRLLDIAIKKRIKTVWLEVRASNENALKFYENKGFIKVYSRINFYAQPSENAFVMKFTVQTPQGDIEM